jgi:carbon-monoxide dehydrogenase large subunit
VSIAAAPDPSAPAADGRFLRGQGRFVDDIALPGQAWCAFVRAPHAHAGIGAIDTASARAMPGVLGVFTGQDMAADGVGPMRCLWPVGAEPARFALARDRARHVGEAVAVVVAQTAAAAADAAEAVAVDWQPLPATADAAAALAPGAALLHPDVPGNLAFDVTRGDAAAVAAALAGAAHRVTLRLRNNRLAGMAIEPRALLAVPDGARTALHATTQVPHHLRRLIAEQLGCRESALRVVAPDVGGGFGYKGKHYPEETVLVWLARRLGRPLRWRATRSEAFLTDYQARDHLTEAVLGLDAEGRFLALSVDTIANLGAWVSTFGAAIPSNIYAALLAGVYATPQVAVRVRGAFTNTVPTDAYRGAGRPEACALLERLADRAARVTGLDSLTIRRRNLIGPGQMPYTAPTGPTYDCGDFPRMLDRVARAADWPGFAARRADSAARGLLRGIGVACFVESAGVAPSGFAAARGARTALYEAATLRAEPDGTVQVLVGTHSHGQGHRDSYARIVAARLGISPDAVVVFEGDTDQSPYGTGTFGSRSIAVGGSAIRHAADRIVVKAAALAAHVLGVTPAAIRFDDGYFGTGQANERLSFAEVARLACIPDARFPFATMEPGLQETAVYDPPNFAWSNGAHVAEVEVDPETGRLALAAYTSVDDIGRVVSPALAEGQVHGGVAQGAGQAMLEAVRHDGEAQLLSGSLMDYAVPRAADLPFLAGLFDESQPCTHNPLGAKGCGEAGAIAAPAAIAGAVLDALAGQGVTEIDMPFTPLRIWQALEAARGSAGGVAA